MKSAILFAVVVLGVSVWAPGTALAQEQDNRDIPLVRHDSSDCSSADVVDDPSDRSGRLLVYRRLDPRTRVRVNLAMQPNTTYHLSLKCIRQLGDITTQADGFAVAYFEFENNLAGNVFAFEMSEDAPLGEKYQSVQVNFNLPASVVPSPRVEYLRQTATSVSFAYADMPSSTEIVLVDATTGAQAGSPPVVLQFGGLGHADIAISSSQPQGTYYLLARGLADKRYTAETVAFYLR